MSDLEVTGSLSDYARDGLREPVVVTKRGRLSTNPKFMAIIERSRASARTRGTLSLEEVRRKYGLPPKAARRRSGR